MSENVAIKVEGVSKSFRLPHNKQSSIKGTLINIFGNGDRTYETQEVLKDISFEVKKGEFFGIVGRNGSGKSTLLKMLAGIYEPTKGKITVNGSLTPFIELGVGFNPELTGRENVYLNSALLGFNNKEVDDMYDDIVQFAELDRFMDQKLKNYSSGMQVRLAFSIAIRARSDILLLDEVLAVGDEAFQRKCNDYFSLLKKQKKTVILVTHSMDAVQSFCTRALHLKDGAIGAIDGPSKVAKQYIRENDEQYANSVLHQVGSVDHSYSKNEPNNTLRLTIHNPPKITKGIARFRQDDTAEVRLRWLVKGVSHVGVALVDEHGRDIFSPNTFKEGRTSTQGFGLGYRIKLNLAPGNYFFKAALFGDTDKSIVERDIEGVRFIVEANTTTPEFVGVMSLEHEWHNIDE